MLVYFGFVKKIYTTASGPDFAVTLRAVGCYLFIGREKNSTAKIPSESIPRCSKLPRRYCFHKEVSGRIGLMYLF